MISLMNEPAPIEPLRYLAAVRVCSRALVLSASYTGDPRGKHHIVSRGWQSFAQQYNSITNNALVGNSIMVDLSLDKGGKGADGCGGGSQVDAASQISCDGGRNRQLTKEKLDLIFAEANPHRQFE